MPGARRSACFSKVGSRDHCMARCGTTAAGFSAGNTMIGFMFSTLGCADVAYVCTNCGDRPRMGIAAGNRRCGHSAKVGTFEIVCDARGHHFNVVAFHTRSRAIQTRGATCIQGDNAVLFLLTQHHALQSPPTSPDSILLGHRRLVCSPTNNCRFHAVVLFAARHN